LTYASELHLVVIITNPRFSRGLLSVFSPCSAFIPHSFEPIFDTSRSKWLSLSRPVNADVVVSGAALVDVVRAVVAVAAVVAVVQ
jgi:hypothetical protein